MLNANSFLILSVGFICLLLGVMLYLAAALRWLAENVFFSTINISWILIALFPALLIFSLFPDEQMHGQIFGFSMTGAVALFVFIWWFGVKRTTNSVNLDKLFDKIRGLEGDLKKAQEIQSTVTTGIKPQVFTETRVHYFSIRQKPKKRIGLITGNLQGVTCADIWVNSENTYMQMSRFFEKSISGTIRYLGARKDATGEVLEDTIMQQLSGLMKGRTSVQPATVLVTDSGQLRISHNVRKIFHVASVTGQVAAGYRSIENIETCVSNVLLRVVNDSESGDRFKTILFPLLGTGAGGGETEEVASRLLQTAIHHLETNERLSIETILFLNWTDRELEICKRVLGRLGRTQA